MTVNKTKARLARICEPTDVTPIVRVALGALIPNVEAALQWQRRGTRQIMVVMEAILAPAVRSFLTTLRQG